MNQRPLLSLQGITFKVDHKSILDQISFDLNPAEFLTIIGPNGAGKTTLLKIIIGLLQPTFGTMSRSKSLRVGYMPQKLMIDEMLPLTVGGFLSHASSREQQKQTIQDLGLQSLLKTSMHHLSGGEFQRVLLARALLNEPSLLILDEPTQGVDVKGQKEFFELLADLRAHMNFAVLMVSHDLYMVHKASDQVLCLNHHICCMGKPEAILHTKEYKALFSDDFVDQLSSYKHRHDHRHDHLETPTEA
jgi:zinc transport system ATP-binding protein